MAAVPELDLARIRAYCERRVPGNLRDQVSVEASVRGKSVTIFDCHPPWHPGGRGWSRVPVAQLRYNPDAEQWTLYWADRNSRWHLNDLIEPGSVAALVAQIDEDPTGIFWG